MKTYNFDEIIDRKHSNCVKYDGYQDIYGTDGLIPLWVADMDFKTPDFVFDAIRGRLNHPVLGYFVHSDGFYRSIIQWMERRHQWKIEKDWIYFAPGIVPGLAFIVQAFTAPGDKVLLQTPVYHPFYYVVQNQSREIVRNPLRLVDNHFEMDYEDLEDKLKKGVKMMILCNPHNPLGRCWTKAELQKVGELCLQYHCLLVSDEIHSDLMMPGYKHTPMANISNAIAQNTITCMAPSKTFNIAGLATSEIIIPNENLRRQFEKVMYDGVHLFVGNIFGELALEACYTYGEEWLEQLLVYLNKNVDLVQQYIKENLPEIKTFRHEATYLPWLDFSGFQMNHEELFRKLANQARVALNDGQIFGEEGRCCFRINVACPTSTLERAMEQIRTTFRP
ncbi:MAG: PatB family C-S lyase [Bacteroidales bacterium]|nr:PatB family C-S lyase [Bacteroidales bacterium]